MRILRLSYFVAVALLAAAALTACKGSGSSSTPSSSTTQLRFIQGNPALQALDYQIDLNGSIITGAAPNVVQPYLSVSAAPHVVSFFSSGTKNPPASPAPTNCQLPALAVGARYTLVLVNPAGTSTTACVLFNEPSVSAGTVVYHNIAGNPTVKDPTGKATANLYPVFCQPQTAPAPCANSVVPAGGPIVNAASSGQTPLAATSVSIPVTFSSATTAPGIAFTVTNSANGGPLCQASPTTLPSDPTVYPVSLDSTDTGNFVPNGSNDGILAIYILDSVNATSGTNACPVAIAASFTL